ncbi:MAG TPA: TonB-dependent receptor [Acidobacteriaceae bacterium]|nr:TonB-dependent receptor [Acidobacteriaceae bacterium]
MGSVSALAQNIFGSIVGTVTDPSGAAVSGATVTITNDATGEHRTAPTSSSGDYQFLSLPPGNYKIEIEGTGFKHYTRDPIIVQVDQSPRVNATMEVGAVSQQVVVTSAAPIMQTETASLGQVVAGKAVTNIPLNGRNVLALVGLVPGVVPQGSSSGNLTGQNVFAAGNYQIGGGNGNQSSVLVDGSPVNTSYGNTVELVPDQDVIQEFKVQTNNNTAEFGMYTGGVINMATKSGSNAFHGTMYEYLRNTVLDANDFFAKRNKAGKQPFHQNQFGGNFGGPIKKDKYFFFGDYQGYRQSQGKVYVVNVPTMPMRTGDFSALPTKIYDPLTTCGYNGNPACAPGATVTRQQFPGNIIPSNRFSSVAKNLINFPYYAKPTSNGTGPLFINNFANFGTSGGVNNQFTLRGDQTISSKQTLFERYTWWKSQNQAANPYGNGLITGDPVSPEAFTTQQGVIGDTYVFNPTTIADLHLSYFRWNYQRTPGYLGYDETKLGLPSYFGQINTLNGLKNSTAVPVLIMANPTYTSGGTGYIFSINNNYVLAPTFTKILGRHTLKTGADLRRLEMNYFQNNDPGGVFFFDNIITGQNASNPQSSGNPFASFLLGYTGATTSIVQIAPPTYQTLYYQGYYLQDTWQANNKLTLTLGLRYEIPGVYVERHNNADTFNPTETNPIVGVPGAFDLVNTPQHPARGVRNEHFNVFSPRLGLAYRLDDNTVIRAGWGRFIIPSDLQFPEAPIQAGVNYITNPMVQSINSNQTPFNTLDNPFPSGILGAPHRNPNYQQILLGGNAQALNANEPNGATYQWNFAIQRQLPLGIALEAAYAGLHGADLPISHTINQLPDSVLNQAAADPLCRAGLTQDLSKCFLTKQVPNPYAGKVSQGALQNSTVLGSQLLRPFPQYGALNNSGNYVGVSNYNSLQLKLEKRFSAGGTLLGAYTFSKLMTNAEYLTSWLDSTTTAGFQDTNNLQGEYALSSFDSRQRLVVSYVYELPIGKGRMFFSNLSGVANTLAAGWGVNGVTTFQEGYPLGMTAAVNNIGNYAYGSNTRPNLSAGCKRSIGGGIFNRLGVFENSANNYFNTSCYTAPPIFTYGNESRTDNQLRTPGIANYDFALYKDTPIHENLVFEFRVESFNLFNRVQFGSPNSQVGNPQFGNITSDLNNPRLLQVAGRITF